MNKAVNEIRLFLFTCSGEDNFILKKCSSSIQKRFALIGFFVLLIFVGCFFSASFFTYSLFEGAKWASIPIGLIWGTVISNLYLLLLHTVCPEIIPLSSKKNDKVKSANTVTSVFNFSMCLRLGFMILLAIIIAQPLNVAFCGKSVESSIEKHKITERVKLFSITNKDLIKEELASQSEFNNKVAYQLNQKLEEDFTNHIKFIDKKILTDKIFIRTSSKFISKINVIDEKLISTEIERNYKLKLLDQLENLLNNELQSDLDFINIIKTTTISGPLKDEYVKYRNNLILLVTEKTKNYNELNNLLNKSNFYVKTIQLLLFQNPISWIITSLVCLAFLLPIFFKYNSRKLSSKLFSKANQSNIIRLREELIQTKDFLWLQNEIKTVDLNTIHTSDYYFQRMLIEHRIILEEYEHTKLNFSKILTHNIKNYNRQSLKRIHPMLEKLKEINLSSYSTIREKVATEYYDELMLKYEYHLDAPFRTKSKYTLNSIHNQEENFLDFIYSSES